MNRLPEYRVWTGTEMVYDVVVGRFGAFYVNPEAKGDGLDPQDSASLTPANTLYPPECPVMEFTGKYNKDGEKIWEGDVLGNSVMTMVVVRKDDGVGCELQLMGTELTVELSDGWESLHRVGTNIYETTFG